MAIQVKIIKQPLYGTVVWDGIDFIYTPNPGYAGKDYYIYNIINEDNTYSTITNYTDTANQRILAQPISLTIGPDTLISIDLNDYVLDDGLINSYFIKNISTPSLGNVSYEGTTIKYISNGYDGTDIFYYTVSDGQYSDTKDISITIINGSDIPVPTYVQDQLTISEGILANIETLSGNWESTYSILCANSAAWNNLDPVRYDAASTVVETNSANWDDIYSSKDFYDQTYSVVNTNSANWNYVFNNIDDITNTLSSNSSYWLDSYNLLSSSSALWDDTTISLLNLTNTFTANSANWDSAYNLILSQSASWDKTFYLNLLSSNSGNWEDGYNLLSSSSALWNDNTNTINSLTSLYEADSINWNSAYITVCSFSAGWGDLFAITLLSANSASWNAVAESKPLYDDMYNVVSATSADWNYVKDNFYDTYNALTATSSNWDTSYNIICSNSADWNNAYLNLQELSTNYSGNSGNWNDVYNTVHDLSTNWENTINLNNAFSSVSGNWYDTYNIVFNSSSNWDTTFNYLLSLSTIYTDNSGNWDTSYSIVCANSAVWSDYSAYNIISANSASWIDMISAKDGYDSGLTVLTTYSADWNFVSDAFTPINDLVSSQSANWNASYNLISSQSGIWGHLSDGVSALSADYSSNSANWQDSYNIVQVNSTYWDNTQIVNTVNDNYLNWNSSYTILCANSGSWDATKTDLTNLTNSYNLSSPLWNSYYNTVTAGSATWGDPSSVNFLTAQSGYYDSAYNLISAQSGTWNNISAKYAKYDTITSIVTSNSSNWTSVYTTVSAASSDWGTITTIITSNSAKWLYGDINTNFIAKDLVVSGNAIFYGSLTADGATTQLNTNVVATSAFSLNNIGNVDAFTVTKTTTSGALANFSTNGNSVLYIDPNNKVGINTSSPNEALTVVGNISASGNVYGQTPAIYTVFQQKSANYEAAYSYISLSGNTINQLLTASKPLYDTAYTYVTGVSSGVNSFLTVSKPSLDSAYTVVTAQSASLDSSYTFLTGNSAKIGIDTKYRSNSANYETAYSWVVANSGATASTAQINVVFDGGGKAVATSDYVIIQIPAKMQILSWNLLADVEHTTTYVDILCSDYNNYPTFPTAITPVNTNGSYPKILNAQKAPTLQNITLSGWTTTVNADALLKFVVTQNTLANVLTLSLKCQKI